MPKKQSCLKTLVITSPACSFHTFYRLFVLKRGQIDGVLGIFGIATFAGSKRKVSKNVPIWIEGYLRPCGKNVSEDYSEVIHEMRKREFWSEVISWSSL